MSVLRAILLLILLKTVSLQDMKDMSISELIQLGKEIKQSRPYDVKKTDLTLFLHTRDVSSIKLELGDNSEVLNTSKSTKIIIHGWLENHKRSWYRKITEEYLKKEDFNIIQVDWERVARSDYISSSINTRLIGENLSDFILNQNFPLENIHLIGHSLGAHIAGFVGKNLNKSNKVARITGLDPAGPYFREVFITENDRLSKDDAEIVDIIHTDAFFYGYEKPIGSLDIYFNGGSRVQPGCLDNVELTPVGAAIENTFCSHARSVLYFIEAINDGKIVCWEKFLSGKILYDLRAEDVTQETRGVCFSETKARKPFLKAV